MSSQGCPIDLKVVPQNPGDFTCFGFGGPEEFVRRPISVRVSVGSKSHPLLIVMISHTYDRLPLSLTEQSPVETLGLWYRKC